MTTTMTAPEQVTTEQSQPATAQSQPATAQPQPPHAAYPPDLGPWVQQPPTKPFRGLAITGLVLSIIGVVFGLIPFTFFMAFPLGILGVIFGAIGFRHGAGKAGAILGAIAIVLGIMWTAVWGNAFNDANTNALGAPVGAVQMVNAS